MKRLLLLSLFTVGIRASEVVLETQFKKLKVAEKPYDEALASEVVRDVLKGTSPWFQATGYNPRGDVSKLIAQEILRDTNFKYVLKPEVVVLKGHALPVNSAEFSPDGKKVVTASNDNTAKVWDVESGELLIDIKGHKSHVDLAVFSPDGKVDLAVFSPDGKKVVTVPMRGEAKVWDADNGHFLTDLKGHKVGLSSVVFSPDGKRVVTASHDNTAKVWDVESGDLLADLKGHTRELSSAMFSLDGNRVVTASYDGTARIWWVADPYLSKNVTLPQAVILLAINTIKWETKDGKFDFNKYSHLQPYYDEFPEYLRKKLDPYVIRLHQE